MSADAERSIDELRLQLTEANEHIVALELAVYRQQQQLDLFQGQLRKLYNQMHGQGGSESLGAALSDDPREDIPPHY